MAISRTIQFIFTAVTDFRIHISGKRGRTTPQIVEYPLPECFAEDFFVSKDYIVFQIKPDKVNPEEILRLAVVKLATVV